MSTRGRCSGLFKRRTHTEEGIAVQIENGRILHDGDLGDVVWR